MAYNYEYPYTDPNRYNDDWLLKRIQDYDETLRNFIAGNEIRYHYPIEWDKSTSYDKSTVVYAPNGDTLLSKQEVPAGIEYTDSRYWFILANYNAQVEEYRREVEEYKQDVEEYENAPIRPDRTVGNILNADRVRIETTKSYYKYDSLPEPVYGAFMGFCEKDDHFLAMKFPIQYKFNFTETVSDLAVITEYDSNMLPTRTSQPLTLYHGNSMTYHNGKIYSCAGSSNGVAVLKIVVIDYETLTVHSEINVERGANFIWFENGFMYTGTRSHIEKRTEDGVLIESISVDLPSGTHSIKPYKDGYILTKNVNNEIVMLDKEFNILKVFSIWSDNVGMLEGELKDIAVVGDDFYIPNNARSYYRLDTLELSELYGEILHFNPYKNEIAKPIHASSYGKYDTVYVDDATTNTIQNGSIEYPFKTIMQAVHYGYETIYAYSTDCFIFGKLRAFITGRSNDKIVHLCDVRDSFITFDKIHISDSPVIANSIKRSTVVFGANATIDSTLNTDYCILNSGVRQLPLNETGMSYLSCPALSTNLGIQKWKVTAASDRVAVPFTSWGNLGIWSANLRIVADGHTFRLNHTFNGSNFRNSYILGSAYYDSATHTISTYITLDITDGNLVATPQYTSIDGTLASNVSITEITVEHLI